MSKRGFLGRWWKGFFRWDDQLRSNVNGLIGEWGTIEKQTDLLKNGIVMVGNDRWVARSSVPIEEGTVVEVIGVEGVTLEVKELQKEREVR